MSIKDISKELIKAFTANNKRLTKLDFSKNQIQVIQNLNDLKHLQILNLSHNQIENMNGLSELITLQQIDLSSNQITTVSNIRNLKNLEILDLSFNRISDFKDLQELRYNKNLQELNVQGNMNITSFYDYRDRIKQMIPSIKKIDGVKIQAYNQNNVPEEQVEQKSIETYQNIISILEQQVQTQNTDALQQWRKKCHELLLREKVMNYRFNQQQTVYQQDIENQKIKIDQILQQQKHIEQELQLKKEEVVYLKENIEQCKIQFENQLKSDTSIIFKSFEQQMDQIQDIFNQQIKIQEKRFFTLEGTLLKQKSKIINQKKMISTDFLEFKQSLKTIIKTYAEKEIQYNIQSEDFVYEAQKIIRDSLIQLKETQFKQSNTNKYEIKELEEEVNSLKQQKKNLQTQLEEQEERILKINRNNDSKQKEIIEELEFKTKKIKDLNQANYDLETKLDKESLEKAQTKSKLNEISENFNFEIKKRIDEATNKHKQIIEELEKENLKLNLIVKEKDIETTQLIETLDKKTTQLEFEKTLELNQLQNDLIKETEERNKFSNQCNNMMKIINMKENKIKVMKDEQRMLQERLNQTVQGDIYYNKGNITRNDQFNNNNNNQMTYQNQRLVQNQFRAVNNQYNINDIDNMRNYEMNNRLNQTEIQYNQQPKPYRSQENWSPIRNNNNNSYNVNKQSFKQTQKNQDYNNFASNKANLILNDLSIINNEQVGVDTLEDEFKKLDQNERLAYDILNDGF